MSKLTRLTVDKIHVKSERVYYDKDTSTQIDETESMLYYKTQTFYCKVELEIPSCIADRDWTVGLVQACDYMYLANDYNGMGHSLWEFHPLKSGLRQMINDSDGRQYPFYSVNQSLYNIKRGFVRKMTLNLQIKDYFHPSVVWELPYSGGVHLTEINRQQKFFIWLVAIKRAKWPATKDEVYVLNKIRWGYGLNMIVDPYLPLGQRVRKVYDNQDNNIVLVEPEKSFKLPSAAKHPPHCNAAQSLIWYPKDPHKQGRVLVPPKQTIVPWNVWVTDMLGPSARIRKPLEVNELIDTYCTV